ncbi:MAG: porin family protein [Myxococcota bacterium]|jgi:opacity protein-like surface antigen|nr:hypothetical protein [Deltaproteobacteria bacterium]MCP4241179.1 porin family protein [bacterium]MDP6075109.1 porin family protein [Myxococcota bacterium]MDP6244389.1 porin family protein [Myxococcota bacterium]MDP7074781.1 porin family protein [Myxococcota bacterium]|tara:strand:+ start:555 stop:1187 length:633 start_codon:yes stop_codon:yes gene_type:complete
MRLALALIALLAPALAEAQDYARPGFYLGAGGTYAFHWFPGDFDEDLAGGPTVRSSDSGGFNLQGGYRVNSWFGAELEYEWIEGFGNRTSADGNIVKLRSNLISVNGKFLYPGWGRWQPYGLLGVGVSIWQAKKTKATVTTGTPTAGLDDTSVGFGGRIGAGLDAYLTENWLLTVGIQAAFSTTKIDNSTGGDLKNLFYIPIQFGVQYRF